MVFCKTCDKDVEAYEEQPSGYLVCTSCGHILDQSAWSTEPTFTKEGGESTVAGHFVSNNAGSHGMGRISGGRMYGFQYDATEKASAKAKYEIERIVEILGIRPRDEVISSAQRLFMLAVQHNFTRGRRTAQIAAATIYIICRQEGHPFMLLDFADVLQVNVFVLGAVFLQLGRIFRLEEHAIMTRPVDPSLYLHRFADRLNFGKKMHQVANTALRLVSSMKRDWLQTGRRPAGICGAALYIAGHIHGFQTSKNDVIRVVHVGEATLDKRVSEFSKTDASDLTALEFEEHSKQVEVEEQMQLEAMEPLAALPAPEGPVTHGCQHVRGGDAMFAHGMCKDCYISFIEVTGGINSSGANPPAFSAKQWEDGPQLALENETRMALPEYAGQGSEAERGLQEDQEAGSQGSDFESEADLEEDMDAALGDESLGSLAQKFGSPAVSAKKPGKRKRKRKAEAAQQDTELKASSGSKKARKGRNRAEQQPSASPAATAGAPLGGSGETDAQAEKECPSAVGSQALVVVPPPEAPKGYINTDDLPVPKEELSDLSDDDFDNYMSTPAEVQLKDIVWTAMNQDYIEKQALKAALIPKAEKSKEPENEGPQDGEGGRKARGRPKGSRTRAREAEIEPAETAAEGVRKMLDAKKLSSKINYENLDILFDADALPPPKNAARKTIAAPPAQAPASPPHPTASAPKSAPAATQARPPKTSAAAPSAKKPPLPPKDTAKAAKRSTQKALQKGKGEKKKPAESSSPEGLHDKAPPKSAAKEKAKGDGKKSSAKQPAEKGPVQAQEGIAASKPQAPSGLRSSALGLGSLRGSALGQRRTTLAPLQ